MVAETSRRPVKTKDDWSCEKIENFGSPRLP